MRASCSVGSWEESDVASTAFMGLAAAERGKASLARNRNKRNKRI
jgi:hypothetical protein